MAVYSGEPQDFGVSLVDEPSDGSVWLRVNGVNVAWLTDESGELVLHRVLYPKVEGLALNEIGELLTDSECP